MLESMLYGQRAQQETSGVYQIIDLRGLSAVALYTGPIGGNGSGFGFGTAPFSVQRELGGSAPLQERFRAGKHEKFGLEHLNLEYFVPGIKKPLINIHIPMNDD